MALEDVEEGEVLEGVMVDTEDTQILMLMVDTDTETHTPRDMVAGTGHPWDMVVAQEQGGRCEEDLVDEDVDEELEGVDPIEERIVYLRYHLPIIIIMLTIVRLSCLICREIKQCTVYLDG